MLQTVDAAVIPQWEEAAVDLATTAVCGSSFFCAAAAASAAATDAAVTANFKTDGGVIHPAVFLFLPLLISMLISVQM